jgi:transposase-like protein
MRRRGAALLALAGLIAGSAVAGFFITAAVAPPPASPMAATGSVTPTSSPHAGPFHRRRLGAGIAGVDLLQQAATTIGISEQQLTTDLQGGQSIAQVAQAHGKTAQEVITALVGDLTTAINKAESSGKITSAQASTLKSHLTAMVTAFVNGTRPPGLGFPGGGARAALQAAAKAIGVTAPQLASDIRNGQSISTVASAHKVKVATVEAAVTAAVDKEIATLKSSGRISASEASQLTAQVPQRVDAWVTGTFPGWPFGPFGGGHPRGLTPDGLWGPPTSSSSSASTSAG